MANGNFPEQEMRPLVKPARICGPHRGESNDPFQILAAGRPFDLPRANICGSRAADGNLDSLASDGRHVLFLAMP